MRVHRALREVLKYGLLVTVLGTVQRRRVICVLLRSCLMPLSALGMMSPGFMLACRYMHSRLLVMLRRILAFFRSLRVLFLDVFWHGNFGLFEICLIKKTAPPGRIIY